MSPSALIRRCYCCCCCYPTPSEGWGHGGRPRSSRGAATQVKICGVFAACSRVLKAGEALYCVYFMDLYISPKGTKRALAIS